jgi:putative PIN family toxin of toxin-antitoxin system
MIRAVIDTNVFVSSALKKEGNEARVLDLVEANRIVPCVTAAILDEYAEVMSRRKLGFSQVKVDALLAGIREKGLIFVLNSSPRMSPDPDDDQFIACAMAADADFIVTGNRRHYPQEFYGRARVVSARELSEFLNQPKV